jgi:alginate O-acetyltransferase complex protein AlgI
VNYTDPVFFAFFAITFAAYYLARSGRVQISILIAASLFFYAWEAPVLLAVFLTSWFITGVSSYGVLKTGDIQQAKRYATIGVVTNLAMLGFFKYKFLVIPHVADLASHAPNTLVDWLLLAPLPIGISFYSFHGISLLIDVYRGNNAFSSEKQSSVFKYLGDTLLYLVFFPQLIAGPIIKAKSFYPQVGPKRFRDIDYLGAFRILTVGYFLKSVIADNLSDQTYWIAYPYFQWRSSADLLVLLYGYSAQIFADFAGYSLIAIGLGKLLGYELPANFNFPYVSTSISDFWRRWHISLSSWLRDYLYIPLGGSQKGTVRTYINLIIVMLLGGLWHGAAWSFAVWGLWHGIGLALERPCMGSRFMTTNHPLAIALRIFLVFNFVTIGWLFFKLQNISEALLYLKTLVSSEASGITKPLAFLIAIYGSAVLLYHIAHLTKGRIPRQLKDVGLGVMIFLIITNPGPSVPFIYFQF